MKVPENLVTDAQKMRAQMELFEQTTGTFNLAQVMLYASLVQEEVGQELLGTKENPGAVPQFVNSLGTGRGLDRIAAAEVLDACGDGIVVLLGLMHSFGADPDEVLRRIWKANFAKTAEDGTLLKREDGKILKPPGWEPPQYGDLIDKIFYTQDAINNGN